MQSPLINSAFVGYMCLHLQHNSDAIVLIPFPKLGKPFKVYEEIHITVGDSESNRQIKYLSRHPSFDL